MIDTRQSASKSGPPYAHLAISLKNRFDRKSPSPCLSLRCKESDSFLCRSMQNYFSVKAKTKGLFSHSGDWSDKMTGYFGRRWCLQKDNIQTSPRWSISNFHSSLPHWADWYTEKTRCPEVNWRVSCRTQFLVFVFLVEIQVLQNPNYYQCQRGTKAYSSLSFFL